MDKTALVIIQKYVDECLFEPRSNWPTHIFNERSCSRWAAQEIMDRIIHEDDRIPAHISYFEPRAPQTIVEDFIDEMDYYVETSKHKQIQLIFSFARDAAKDILQLIRKEQI